jgi:hypothetical protein
MSPSFNKHESFFKLAQKFSPTKWLATAAVMLLLTLLSAYSLYQRPDENGKDRWVFAHESIVIFIHDTIQLAFIRDKGPDVIEIPDAIRIAPLARLIRSLSLTGSPHTQILSACLSKYSCQDR